MSTLWGRELSGVALSNRQIWLTKCVSLLLNSQLWIVQMVGYYCFGLQKSTTEQK